MNKSYLNSEINLLCSYLLFTFPRNSFHKNFVSPTATSTKSLINQPRPFIAVTNCDTFLRLLVVAGGGGGVTECRANDTTYKKPHMHASTIKHVPVNGRTTYHRNTGAEHSIPNTLAKKTI